MGNEQDERAAKRRIPQRVLTLAEVAEYLHVHRSTIYRLVSRNDLEGFKIGRDWRFNMEQIDERFTPKILETAEIKGQTPAVPAKTAMPKREDSAVKEEHWYNRSARSGSQRGNGQRDSTRGRRSERSLKDALTDLKTVELSGQLTSSSRAFDNPPSGIGELADSELDRLRHLEEENSRLKRIVAEQCLEIHTLRDVLTEKAQ